MDFGYGRGEQDAQKYKSPSIVQSNLAEIRANIVMEMGGGAVDGPVMRALKEYQRNVDDYMNRHGIVLYQP